MTDFKNYLKLSLPCMKWVFALLICSLGFHGFAQTDSLGIITGSVLDEKGKALDGATVQLISFKDSLNPRSFLTQQDGVFKISEIAFGYYRLRISYSGMQSLTLDSIHFRADRYDFNLNDLILKSKASNEKMEEVIIYAEKPLIESKDGNITFNAGESALTAGSNASDLLTTVPLVTKDPSGKLLVRGKEPKILIDDKPVELNLQQLQDLLESMPGSSVEKIEVMTNPPPQYANEQGGVINIVTRKGTVGMNGRLSIYAGTRGEAGTNGSFNYRKQGLSINVNAGAGYNQFEGNGYSRRENLYKDSSNFFNTTSNYLNKNIRPNFRATINYDLNKFNSLSLVMQYNQNDFDNHSFTEYRNLNRFNQTYRLNERNINSKGHSYNPNLNLTYLLKTKKQGESLRLISDINASKSNNTRNFYQEYFNPDHSPNGRDSTQEQTTDNRTRTYTFRLNYELPLDNKKTFLSAGGFYSNSTSDIHSNAVFLRSTDREWVPLSALINDFRFRQQVANYRASLKQILGSDFSTSAGIAVEHTAIFFNLYKNGSRANNDYWSFLPFANINRNWREKLNLTFSYRRTIRRPGVNELNPTIDSSDAYTLRSGNTNLMPSLAHNFDLVLGKTNKSFYLNLGLGYNIVDDIFSQIRTRLSDTTTQVTWENISGRKEYEMSTWSGYTLSKHTRVNLSASYTYNTYSQFDKEVRKYRDGGSLTSNLNMNYIYKELYTATGSFTFNRFANPQGTVKSTLSMNIGLQAKLMKKKLTATINIIDPFVEQKNRTFTYGTNFNLESFSSTQTRNFRLSLGYSLSRKPKKKPNAANKQALQKAIQKPKPNQ
jgi:hypothetical protein